MKAQMIWSRGELETLDRCPACNKSIESKPLYKRYDD